MDESEFLQHLASANERLELGVEQALAAEREIGQELAQWVENAKNGKLTAAEVKPVIAQLDETARGWLTVVKAALTTVRDGLDTGARLKHVGTFERDAAILEHRAQTLRNVALYFRLRNAAERQGLIDGETPSA